jgi:hypothetical protein
MPSARALLVASLLTEPPYGCLGPPGNDRYRKRSLRSQTVGALQVDCQGRVGSFARNQSPADMFGRCYKVIHRNDRAAFCRKSRRVPSVVGLEVGPWPPSTEEGKIKRTRVRFSLRPKKLVCTLACAGSGAVSNKGSGIAGSVFPFNFNTCTASGRYDSSG